jgi:hypothetical protein
MSAALYDVLFAGELLPDADPALTRQRLAALFRIEPDAVERLFAGTPVVIRKAVEEGVAHRYQQAMRQCGAVCTLRAVSSADTPDAIASADAAEEFAPDLSSAVLLPPGTPFPQPPPARPPQFDFSELSLAEPGVDLVEPRPVVPAPVPDISGISLVEEEN